jgi:hypothetical protein
MSPDTPDVFRVLDPFLAALPPELRALERRTRHEPAFAAAVASLEAMLRAGLTLDDVQGALLLAVLATKLDETPSPRPGGPDA